MKLYTIGIMGWWAETRYRVKGHLLQTQIDGVLIEPRMILRLDDDTTVIIRKILKKDYKVYPDFYFKEPEECQEDTKLQKKNTDTDTEEEPTEMEEPLPPKSTEEPILSERTSPVVEKPSESLIEIISRI